MNAYLDSSALVKLPVREPDSDAVAHELAGCTLFTCRLSYTEARSAIARREREVPERSGEWSAARRQLDADWPACLVIDVKRPLVERAAEFCDSFGLRAYGAVQLAAAQLAHAALQEPMPFRSHDRRLNRAARLLGLLLPEGALL